LEEIWINCTQHRAYVPGLPEKCLQGLLLQ